MKERKRKTDRKKDDVNVLLFFCFVSANCNYVPGFAPSQIECRSCKSPSEEQDCIQTEFLLVCIRMQKDHIRTFKIMQSMSKFDGLWKHQNNPACTKSVITFIMLKMGTIQKKKKKKKTKKKKKKKKKKKTDLGFPVVRLHDTCSHSSHSNGRSDTQSTSRRINTTRNG